MNPEPPNSSIHLIILTYVMQLGKTLLLPIVSPTVQLTKITTTALLTPHHNIHHAGV